MSNYLNEQADKMAGIFKALSNPHRLRIFRELIDCCPPEAASKVEGCCSDKPLLPCVSDLGKDLGIAPSTLSHHLKELSYAGLVKMERRGQHIYCSTNEEVFGVLEDFFSFVKSRNS